MQRGIDRDDPAARDSAVKVQKAFLKRTKSQNLAEAACDVYFARNF